MRHERSVGPSPRAIDEAIAARVSSAGWFQRVAEQIARGFYPDRPVTPFGRNPADKTVAGWPDAYILWDEGGVIAIEATTEAKARQRHWAEDLQKLRRSLPRDQRQGLIWVAWEHEPPPDDVARWQRVGRQRRPEQVGEPPARPRARGDRWSRPVAPDRFGIAPAPPPAGWGRVGRAQRIERARQIERVERVGHRSSRPDGALHVHVHSTASADEDGGTIGAAWT